MISSSNSSLFRPGSRIQIALIFIVAGAIVVLLNFVNTRPPAKKKEAAVSEMPQGPAVDEQIRSIVSGLSDADHRRFEAIEIKLLNTLDQDGRSLAYQEMIAFWKDKDEPLPAAWFTRQYAELINDTELQGIAAGYFLMAARRSHDRPVQVVLGNEARKSYEKVLAADNQNIEAMLGLGEIYVRASDKPMEGITLIKKVLAIDPENTDAIIMLGEFNIMNGSLDKAIERFNEALVIDPSLYGLYYRIADVYLQMNDKAKAIEYLEKYSSYIKDPFDKSQLEDYIKRIKNQ